jgi:hypothetical protein
VLHCNTKPFALNISAVGAGSPIDPTKVQQPIYSHASHTANVALLGNYMASTFVTSSDGHGGTNVIDPVRNGDKFRPLSSFSLNTLESGRGHALCRLVLTAGMGGSEGRCSITYSASASRCISLQISAQARIPHAIQFDHERITVESVRSVQNSREWFV